MDIRDLQINDLWCRLSERVVSLGCNALPKDVHCTLVFDKKLNDINFHLTKNITNHNNKPQVKIVIVEKEVLWQIAENIPPLLFMNLLERFDIKEYQAKYGNEVGFISTDNIKNSDLEIIIRNAFFENFTDISTITANGKELKIKGDLNSKLDDFAKTDGLIESIFEAAEYITETYENPFDVGVLLTEDEVKHILRINDEWFTFSNLTVFELLSMFVTRETAYHIICKAEHALQLLEKAQTYADTEKHNDPIRIILPTTDLSKFVCPKCKLSGLDHNLYC